MVNHYFTLVKLIEEIKPALTGAELVECYSQEKNSTNFVFFDGSDEYVLQYTVFENKPVLFINNNIKRARKNTITLFQQLLDNRLQNITIHSNNRIIEFIFINFNLVFYIFSPGNSNIFLTDRNNIIVDTFKKDKILKGTELKYPKNNLKNIYDYSQDEKIFNHIIKSELLLTKYYCKELFYKLNLSENLHFKDLNTFETNNIIDEAKIIKQKCLSTKDYIIYDYDNTKLLSLIPLTYLNSNFEKFTSINQAILYKYKYFRRYSAFYEKKKMLVSKFEKRYNQLINKIKHLTDEESSLERIRNYRKWAEIIMSYPIHKNKKLDKIKLLDFDGKEVIIPLNIKKTVIENANDYFLKAKKSEKELSIRKKILPELQEQLQIVEKILNYVNEAQHLKDLDKIMNEFSDYDGIIEKNHNETKFRMFDLGEGFILYVGKNAANNDELTMKFAKPNDLWFHARGAGGSHAILRLNKNQKPSKNIIKKAASIVAYYSQARKAKYVPVVYTYRKYVRKPKGANIGTVTISKENVIMVEPSLPS